MDLEKARTIIFGGGPTGIATAVKAKAAGIDPVYRKIKVEAIGRLLCESDVLACNNTGDLRWAAPD